MQEWKMKIAVLWLLQTVNYLSYILIGLFETEPFGATIEDGAGLVVSIFFFVPCLLAFVSLVYPSSSRWPNIVFGAVFASLKLAGTLGLVGNLSVAIFINEIWGFFAAGLIVWYAWKLPTIAGTEV
jgi:hypothetical protein